MKEDYDDPPDNQFPLYTHKGFLYVMRMDILELLDTGQRVSRVSEQYP